MAAALVPLAIEAAPAIINGIISLIAGLVHKKAPVIEDANGPGTGPVKFADLFGAVMMALQNAAAAGQIPKQLPPDEAIKGIIQAVVTSMKLFGLLDGSVPVAPAAASQTLVLKAGQSLTITVAA